MLLPICLGLYFDLVNAVPRWHGAGPAARDFACNGHVRRSVSVDEAADHTPSSQHGMLGLSVPVAGGTSALMEVTSPSDQRKPSSGEQAERRDSASSSLTSDHSVLGTARYSISLC